MTPSPTLTDLKLALYPWLLFVLRVCEHVCVCVCVCIPLSGHIQLPFFVAAASTCPSINQTWMNPTKRFFSPPFSRLPDQTNCKLEFVWNLSFIYDSNGCHQGCQFVFSAGDNNHKLECGLNSAGYPYVSYSSIQRCITISSKVYCQVLKILLEQ